MCLIVPKAITRRYSFNPIIQPIPNVYHVPLRVCNVIYSPIYAHNVRVASTCIIVTAHLVAPMGTMVRCSMGSSSRWAGVEPVCTRVVDAWALLATVHSASMGICWVCTTM